GSRRGRQRAIHLGAIRLRPREGWTPQRHRHGRGDAPPAARRRPMKSRIPIIGAALVVTTVGVGVWLWLTAGRQSTDDAQVDAPVTQVAARVGGIITKVAVNDNQRVEPAAVLVELDPRDYQ